MMGGEFLGSPIPNTLIYITHLLWNFFYHDFQLYPFYFIFYYQKLHSIVFSQDECSHSLVYMVFL